MDYAFHLAGGRREIKQEDVRDMQRLKAIDYLWSLKELGAERFLAKYSWAVLLESSLVPSSRRKLFRLETISRPSGVRRTVMAPAAGSLLQAGVISLEKREPNSPAYMLFVGRAANNDVVLPNKLVSKLHAYFRQVPGSQKVQLVDMNSTNGTFINGKRLVPGVKTGLNDADEVCFGPETRLQFFSPPGFRQLLQRLA